MQELLSYYNRDSLASRSIQSVFHYTALLSKEQEVRVYNSYQSSSDRSHPNSSHRLAANDNPEPIALPLQFAQSTIRATSISLGGQVDCPGTIYLDIVEQSGKLYSLIDSVTEPSNSSPTLVSLPFRIQSTSVVNKDYRIILDESGRVFMQFYNDSSYSSYCAGNPLLTTNKTYRLLQLATKAVIVALCNDPDNRFYDDHEQSFHRMDDSLALLEETGMVQCYYIKMLQGYGYIERYEGDESSNHLLRNPIVWMDLRRGCIALVDSKGLLYFNYCQDAKRLQVTDVATHKAYVLQENKSLDGNLLLVDVNGEIIWLSDINGIEDEAGDDLHYGTVLELAAPFAVSEVSYSNYGDLSHELVVSERLSAKHYRIPCGESSGRVVRLD